MSQEEVEIRNEVVRRFYLAFESDTDAFRDTLHPEIEWFGIEKERKPSKGVEACMWDRNEWLDTWDEHQFDLEEVVEEGSGVEAELRFWSVLWVREGQITRRQVFLNNRAEALEAAGLQE